MTIQDIQDFVNSSTHNLTLNIEIHRGECRIYAYDHTLEVGTFVSSIETAAQELLAARDTRLQVLIASLKKYEYEAMRNSSPKSRRH